MRKTGSVGGFWLVSLLLALMLFVTFAVTAYAAEAEEYFVIDDADILTDSEVNTMDKKLAELSSMKITQSGDYFMYRNLTKTQRQKSSSSSSSGGSSRSTGGGSF